MSQNKRINSSLPIFMAFLCMGFGDVVGPMVSLVKDSFEVSNFVASLITFSGFIMFGLLSIPMGLYQDRKTKKQVLIIGLAVAFAGLALPMFFGLNGQSIDLSSGDNTKLYILFISIFLMGAGAATLQVSGNPIMRDVSSAGKYASNLSLGQAIKAIGSSIGFLLPPAVAGIYEWTILFPIYAIVILLTLIWVQFTKITEEKESGAAPASLSSSLKLFTSNRFVFMMVMGIFLYVGAEVSMSAQLPILMKDVFNLEVGLWLTWGLYFLPIFIGRLLGSAILRKIKAGKFLGFTVILSILGMALLFSGTQSLTFAGIFLIGLGFANIFPLIFSITVDKMPERTNELSGLMVTAIVGGAAIPPISGLVADINILYGFIVPAVCLLYIGILAKQSFNK